MRTSTYRGFTIVELLIVIVVIAILAVLTIVSYGIVNERARIATLEANLSQLTKSLELYGLNNSANFPTSLESSNIKLPENATYTYTSNGRYYCLTATVQNNTYRVMSNNTRPTDGNCVGILADGSTCPVNWVLIPGNAAFSTNEFCIMKYEARNVGGVATSQPTGAPWTNISQTSAISTAAAACSGCRLMTDAEWMTLAANIYGVGSNWSGGSVGSGYVFAGHTDGSPAAAIDASTDDSNGYINTGNTSGQTASTSGVQGNSQRRTHTLNTGEVVWDLMGNVWEQTSGTLGAGQLPGLVSDGPFVWRQWNTAGMVWGGLSDLSKPGAVSPAAASYSSAQGIGMIYTSRADGSTRSMSRGGNWGSNVYAGIFSLLLQNNPTNTNANVGFRVVK